MATNQANSVDRIVYVGASAPEFRTSIDASYRKKYRPSGHRSMATDDAAATTLRLEPE
jgi:hypothetical protein